MPRVKTKKKTRSKLTDKQKKKIYADYINNNNYSETGRMNGVSKQTVIRVVKSFNNTETERKVTQKKEENTKDILDYMDSVAEDQKEIIKLSMEAMKEKLKNPDMFTNVKDIAMVYGIIFDKALKSKELKQKNNTPDNRKTVIVNDLPR